MARRPRTGLPWRPVSVIRDDSTSAGGVLNRLARHRGPIGMAEAPYTRTEETAHCLTHAVGIVGSLVAIPWLAVTAATGGDPWRLVGGLIFAVCALLMFSTSVAYHAAAAPRTKTRLRTLDHTAIYLLIDLGHLHADRPRRDAWRLGVEHLRRAVGARAARHHRQDHARLPVSPDLDVPVPRDGVDRHRGDQAADSTNKNPFCWRRV